mmetsp:Transcript_40537/g.99597  ORF Transcript_40537/g.99597 Transcript_40537/m.99597 type:complete len:272 (-) Transcript_40537:671-1486(-)
MPVPLSVVRPVLKPVMLRSCASFVLACLWYGGARRDTNVRPSSASMAMVSASASWSGTVAGSSLTVNTTSTWRPMARKRTVPKPADLSDTGSGDRRPRVVAGSDSMKPRGGSGCCSSVTFSAAFVTARLVASESAPSGTRITSESLTTRSSSSRSCAFRLSYSLCGKMILSTKCSGTALGRWPSNTRCESIFIHHGSTSSTVGACCVSLLSCVTRADSSAASTVDVSGTAGCSLLSWNSLMSLGSSVSDCANGRYLRYAPLRNDVPAIGVT